MTQTPRRVGLVLARATQVLGEEPYYHEFIEGLERVLTPAGISVLLRVVPNRAAETAVYERWSELNHVDGVILVDLSPGDTRVGLVGRLGLPAVVLGDPSTATGLPTVWTDDAGFAREVVRFVAGLGHEVIGHVSGPLGFAHTQLRRGGFAAGTGERGLTLIESAADYSFDAGRIATAGLVAKENRPTVIVYDNDVMALGGLQAIFDAGLGVPADISVVAWDDSALCQLSVPPLTAMSHDVVRIGELAAGAMGDALAGITGAVYEAPYAHVVLRDSTGHPSRHLA